MIHTMGLTKDHQLITDFPLDAIHDGDLVWYWVDFDNPTEEEAYLLEKVFHFHPLAIEDCMHFLQRPKLDEYDGYSFLVLHALRHHTLEAEEVDLFIGENYLVSFHFADLTEIRAVRHRVKTDSLIWHRGPLYLAYLVMDNLVDQYFPDVYAIEDRLHDVEDNTANRSVRMLMDKVFDIRSDLLKLRRTVFPMRDLFYRIVHTNALRGTDEQRVYFIDIYDHLLKLSEIIESNREVTADLRDSYLSLNANRTNTIMMTLTVITTIFMPLTFIAGVYGMNFENMPELKWEYGYYIVLGVMAIVGLSMYVWFRKKGWFSDKG